MNDNKNSVTDALQPVKWPIMPPSKGQSPILFEDGYDEGWAKCLEACKAALAATKQENNMTIFALEQCVENKVDLNISDAESALAELNTIRAQLAEAQRDAEVSTQINRACAELPDDYRIVIEIERDAGWVCLLRRSEDMDFDDPCEDIASSISAAIDAAKGEPS